MDEEGIFALKYGEFGGIKKKKIGQKSTLGPYASPFFFCHQSGKNLAKIKLKIIGLDLYESFQKYQTKTEINTSLKIRATPLAQVSHFFFSTGYIYIAKKLY